MSDTFSVANESDLESAIDTIDGKSSGSYTIQFTATITLADALSAINLPTGVSLTIDGQGNSLDGASTFRGLFVKAGTVTIEGLTIKNAVAQGGAGGSDGGGGAGLGGGLFVGGTSTGGGGGNVTLSGVTFTNDSAIGGDPGSSPNTFGGGGGGLVGEGGTWTPQNGGGAGGGPIANFTGGAGGDNGASKNAAGGAGAIGGFGGGGGGGGVSGSGGQGGDGGQGGFGGGGGGGGVGESIGSIGGAGGQGGFGGGGGGGGTGSSGGGPGGAGGFGAGSGAAGDQSSSGAGGGGLGAGGDIFVQQGGSLTIEGSTLGAGTVHGGATGSPNKGSAFGDAIFLQGVQAQKLVPPSAQTLTISGAIADQEGSAGGGNPSAGLIINGAGTVDLAATNSFAGGTTLQAGTLVLGAPGAAGTGSIDFGAANNQTLNFTQANSPSNTIQGFAQNDSIILSDFAHNPSNTVTTNGDLVTVNGMSGPSATLNIAGASGIAFALSDAPVGGTELDACFAAGTRIATSRGEVAVEDLGVGDRVVALRSGRLARAVWLGHRTVACQRHPRPWDVQPVRVAAGAFGPDQPLRPLLLSPDHALYVDGVLIPVRYLINGASIAQLDVERITYWHIELEQHDVLLAEGMPAESYLDTGNRGAFANSGEPVQKDVNFALGRWKAAGCAELVLDGERQAPIRRRLLDRAMALGHALTDEDALCFEVDGRRVSGLQEGMTWHVDLPPGSRWLRLISRHNVPAYVHPESVDTRRLGVAVTTMMLDNHTLPLDDPRLESGWHQVEPMLRWTDGTGTLDVTGATEMELTVAPMLRYWVTSQELPASEAPRAAATGIRS